MTTTLSGSTMDSLRAVGLDPEAVRHVVELALAEDLGGPAGVDVTSVATIAVSQHDIGDIVARAGGTVAGLAVAQAVFDVASARRGRIRPARPRR